MISRHDWQWIPLMSKVLSIDIPHNERTSNMEPQTKLEVLQNLIVQVIQNSSVQVIAIDNCEWYHI